MTRLNLASVPKIRATNFQLQRLQAMNPVRGGNHQVVDMGEPLWTCEIETAPLSREQGGGWKWLLAKLRGGLNTLMLYDASRPRPLAYIDNTSDAFVRIGVSRRIGAGRRIGCKRRAWGEVSIIGVDRENSRIKLRAASLVLGDGDYGAWDDGVTRRLFIFEAVTITGEGWVTCEPAPPASSTALPAALELHRASAEMIVVQSQAPYSAPVTHQVTLSAGQVLRRS